jgi:transcriptional antiterminator RfaH
LRTQTKHEHIAAARLKKIEGVEIFLPRIRFKRATQSKSAWVTEALFPGYLFARFDWNHLWRQVNYSPGVSEIVHFGEYCPTIPEGIIGELRSLIGPETAHTIEPALVPGDVVQITDGTLKGLQAVISQVLPARQRVAVLMEILGRQTTIEVTLSSLIKEGNKRASFLPGASRPQP